MHVSHISGLKEYLQLPSGKRELEKTIKLAEAVLTHPQFKNDVDDTAEKKGVELSEAQRAFIAARLRWTLTDAIHNAPSRTNYRFLTTKLRGDLHHTFTELHELDHPYTEALHTRINEIRFAIIETQTRAQKLDKLFGSNNASPERIQKASKEDPDFLRKAAALVNKGDELQRELGHTQTELDEFRHKKTGENAGAPSRRTPGVRTWKPRTEERFENMSTDELLEHVEAFAAEIAESKKSRQTPLTDVEKKILEIASEQRETQGYCDRENISEQTQSPISTVTNLINRYRGMLPPVTRLGQGRKQPLREVDENHPLVHNHVGLMRKEVGDFLKAHPEAYSSSREIEAAALTALVRAAEIYEDRGPKFSAYAVHAIRGGMKRELEKSRKRAKEISLNEPLKGVEGKTMEDSIGKEHVEANALNRAEFKNTIELIHGLHKRGKLSGRQLLAFLLVEYHGLRKTEVARALGVSRQRVGGLLQAAQNNISSSLKKQTGTQD